MEKITPKLAVEMIENKKISAKYFMQCSPERWGEGWLKLFETLAKLEEKGLEVGAVNILENSDIETLKYYMRTQ